MRTLPFVDSHCHLDDEQFSGDVDAVIDRAIAAGAVGLVNIAYEPSKWESTGSLLELRPEIVPVVGIHPGSASSIPISALDELQPLIDRWHPVGIGESGLDYFRGRSERSDQLRALESQLELALLNNLPLILHLRGDVESDLLAVLNTAPDSLVCVLHSFDGSETLARTAEERGWYLGAGGLSTRKSNERLRGILSRYPADRLLLETDSPYLVPYGSGAKRNEPAFIPLIAASLADVCGFDQTVLMEQLLANSIRLFGSRVAPLLESRATA